ncbi:class I SAM-dependent methyltransferase [Pendulispora brunnea]|uniref:Class I SAM-dependent methyltransferase n=1 Tax=Pendulispora brunnea TaxID=2905690 RepID=A0ABZ2KGA7_9BACT
MDIRTYNREAWDRAVAEGDRWTIPVSREAIARAREGDWHIILTPRKPVPRSWFPVELEGLDVLCLASGGGQQAPILAAAGATVTVFDNSPAQLGQDRLVAEREGLSIRTVEGDMRDLSALADASFDLIFHPVSNCFVENVRPVWRECARVLRAGGTMLAGLANPVGFCFDVDQEKKGELVIRYGIPYSDKTSLTDQERRRYTDKGEALQFGHTLEDQIGGQIDAGFSLIGYYDDLASEGELVAKYMPTFFATRARKNA